MSFVLHCFLHCSFVVNSAKVLDDNEITPQSNYVQVSPHGRCRWAPRFEMSVTQCPVVVTWFPFDRQRCQLVFESWVLQDPTLKLYMDYESVFLENYRTSDEWHLLGTCYTTTFLLCAKFTNCCQWKFVSDSRLGFWPFLYCGSCSTGHLWLYKCSRLCYLLNAFQQFREIREGLSDTINFIRMSQCHNLKISWIFAMSALWGWGIGRYRAKTLGPKPQHATLTPK